MHNQSKVSINIDNIEYMRKYNSRVTKARINTNSKQNHKHRDNQHQIGNHKQNNTHDMKQRVASLNLPDIT